MNKKITIKKIDTFSLVRLTAFIGLILNFFVLLFTGFRIVTGTYANPLTAIGSALLGIFLLELYIVVISALYCWFYNMMASKFGGVQFEISED